MWRPPSCFNTNTDINEDKRRFTTPNRDVYHQSGGQIVRASGGFSSFSSYSQIPDQSCNIMWPVTQSSDFSLPSSSFSSSCSMQWTPTPVTNEHADVFTPDQDGDLLLHVAVAKEDIDQVNAILQVMQYYNHPIDVFNNLRQTPLHLAVMVKNKTLIQRLLSFGASPCVTDRGGNSSVHLAARAGCKECLALVLESPITDQCINSLNFEGFAPLHLAVFIQNVEIIKTLVCRNADIDVVDGKSGRTPLFYAIERSYEEIVELLLSLGASVNLANYSGITPLIVATDRGNTTVTSMLISRGAMISSRDDP